MVPGTMIKLLDKIRYLNRNADLTIQRNPSTIETMLYRSSDESEAAIETFVYPSARNSLVIIIKKYLNTADLQ